MEKEYKSQLNSKETEIIQLQAKIEILSGNKKPITTPEIKRVLISNSSKEKQNINYNNYELYNNKNFSKKEKNQTLDYISQLAKNKTINILNNNISIKTIKNYHPNSMSMNNNINENKIPFYKFPKNEKYNNQKNTLEKNNSAPNILLNNAELNSNNVRKKFFINNSKKSKYKNSKINIKGSGINFLIKENNDTTSQINKEGIINQKNNYKKLKLPFYIASNNQNFANNIKVNLNTNIINENLIEKIKRKNLEEYNKIRDLKLDEMDNIHKIKTNSRKKIKSCESRKLILQSRKLNKKYSKIMSTSDLERDINKNNSTFNTIFKNLNYEKGRNNRLKNMILNRAPSNKIIYNIQNDKSNINNSNRINLNNISEKIYLDNFNKITSKKTIN